MNDKVLSIIIRAQDKASQVFDQVGERVDKVSDRVHAAASRMAKAGALAGAAAAAVFSTNAVKSAIDLGESINAVEKTFGSAADQIFEFGQIAAEQAGLSKAAFNSAVVPIGSMLLNMGLAEDKAAASSIELGKRAADLASVFNADLSEALTAIQAGLRGEADPLERFGVGLNQTAVQAYALKNGIIAQGQAMDASALATARLGLFMEQTNRFAGDFVQTSDSAANQQRILKAEFENQSVIIGQKLLPVWSALLAVSRSLINDVIPNIESGINRVTGFFGQLWPVIQSVSNTISGLFMPSLNALWSAISDRLSPSLDRLWNQLSPVLVPAIQVIGAVIGGVLVAALWSAINVLNVIISTLSWLIDKISAGISWVSNLATAFSRAFSGIRGSVESGVSGIYDTFISPFRRAWEFIQDIVNKIEGAVSRVNNAAGSVTGAGGRAVDRVSSWLNPFRAEGGPVSAGQPYIVGEREPELFVPNQSGTILNQSQMREAGIGGATYNFHGNIYLTTPQAVDRFADRFEMGQLGAGV